MRALRRQVFFKLNRVLGSRCERAYREFLAWERMPDEVFAARRRERLAGVLAYARQHIPFYRARVTAPEPDLSDYPVLRKADVRDNYRELMAEGLRREYDARSRRGYSWVEVKTGGSTGVPTAVIHDRDFRDFDRAARLYAQRLCGFEFGTPYFRLWGSMKDINRMTDSLSHRLMAWLGGERLLNAFRMEPDHMRAYIDRMATSKIRYLMAYVDAAYHLARFAEQQGLSVPRLDSIMACAGTVTADVRLALERVFRAAVFNKYGSRDAGDMACDCGEGRLHVFGNRYLLEVVDALGNPAPPGTAGRILVTVLGNRRFPLIRYEIGDVGVASHDPCPCGSAFPMLASVEGRTVEFLTGTEGGYVSPVYVRHVIGVVHNPGCIERFQLTQEDDRRFDLALQVNDDVPAPNFEELCVPLRRDLQAVLGGEAELQIRRVASIAESASGKFLYCVNRSAAGDRAVSHEDPVRP